MKREELTQERQKQLKSIEWFQQKVFTDKQIEEYNQLCDEVDKYPENKLEISALIYAELCQKQHKMLTRLGDYRDPDDEEVLTDEQILKKLYIKALKEYKEALDNIIVELDDKLDTEIGNKKRLIAKDQLRKEIEIAKDKFNANNPYSVFDDLMYEK
jgi:hypothetical protein